MNRFSMSLSNVQEEQSAYSSRRAPDPTQKGRRGVSTVNVKRQAAIAKTKSTRLQEEKPNQSSKSKSKDSLAKLLSVGRPSSDKMKRLVTRNAKKKRMKKANTNNIKNDDELSDGIPAKPRSRRTMSLKGTMPRKMKNLLSNFYKKKPVGVTEANDEEIDLLNTERELMNEAEEGYTDKSKFKQNMLKRYGNGVGSYGFSMDKIAQKPRRDSSFGPERPMVLFLGRSRAGKSTIFKQLMTLSGAPPNYARAYIATKTPVEEDITIDETEMTLVDIGGANEDIVDWRFYLTSAEVIVYVVALDEYDRVVPGKEGDGKTRPYTYLKESIELFDSIINNVALLNSKFVLILNKADRFKKKIVDKKISLRDTNAYEDAPITNEYEESLEFIEDLFLERAEHSEHEVEIEVTSAIDSDQCNEVLERITQRLAKGKDVTKWKNLL